MKTIKQKKIHLAGQTLIETLAAAFILVMGISASVGLAIFAFNTSGGIVKQIIATGLAREGVEAVRNMRDTNWLQDTLVTNGCYDYVTATANKANCYPNWLNKTFCLDPTNNSGNCNGNGNNIYYYVGFDSNNPDFWVFAKENANYGINLDKNNSGTSGFYSETGNTNCLNATSDYCRRIFISKITTPPYDQDVGPLLFVQSQVWWIDKKCPRVSTFDKASVTCRLELDTYLTNWKNF